METAGTENGSTKTGSAFLRNFLLAQYFQVGPLQIHFYGIILAGAILIGYLVARAKTARFNIEKKQLDDVGFWLVIWSIIGARLYYVLFYPQFFRNGFLEIFRIWHGGQSIYGALIAGAATLFYFSRKTKITFFRWTDLMAFALPLAQAFGRLGNFFNYEAFGLPTNLPWKIFIPVQHRPPDYLQYEYFHPAFAYELIWNIVVFLILLLVEKVLNKKLNSRFNFTGIFTALYLFFYSLGRFVIEGIRLDSAYFGPFRGDQLTALCLMVAALGIISYRYVSQTRN